MAVLTPQQRLDATGVLELSPGTTAIAQPLFLDQPEAVVVGRPGSFLDAQAAGVAFVAGWQRRHEGTPLSAAHWTDGTKFRTRVNGVDTCLYGMGTPWDTGPNEGWSAVTKINVTVKAVLHSPATWHSVPLGGVNAHGPGIPFGPHPRPWLMYWEGADLKFAVTTADGIERVFAVVGPDPTAPQLRVRVILDLNAGTITADDAGSTPYHVDATQAGVGWGPGLKLADNDLFPFNFGRFTSDWGSAGPDGQWPDLTVEMVRVETYSPGWTNLHTNDASRGSAVIPYPGADPLPILGTRCDAVVGSAGRAHLMVLRKGTYHGTGDVRLHGVQLQGLAGNPCLTLGTIAAGLTVEDCRFVGGSRGVSHARAANVSYPLRFSRVNLDGQRDCGLFLHGVPQLSVRDCQIRFAGRRAAVLVQCDGLVEDVFMAPASTAREFVFDQRGGRVAYERCLYNAEGGAGPQAFLRVVGESWEQPWFATGARVTDCSGGYVAAGHGPLNRMALVRVDPRRPGYVPGTGPDAWLTRDYRVVVDQTDAADAYLTGAGLSDPTVSVTVNGVAHAGVT